jgi:hypothetical protein
MRHSKIAENFPEPVSVISSVLGIAIEYELKAEKNKADEYIFRMGPDNK